MKRPCFQSDRGFTLTEMMISLGILTLVVLLVAETYSQTSTKYIRNRDTFQARTLGLLGADYITYELRNAGYIIGWDATPDAPPIAVNMSGPGVPIPGATVAPNTESLTVRYARGPLTGVGAPVAVLNGVFAAGSTTLTVQPLTFAIANGTLVAIYSPPTSVNVRRVSAASNAASTTISLANPTSNNFATGDVVTIVEESSFWIDQGTGSLWMRRAGTNQQLASNVEDLQIVLHNADQSTIGDVSSAAFAGMTTAQLLNVRAVRLSLSARSSRTLRDQQFSPPLSLEDHDRSGEPADQVFRVGEQTTVYLRNFAALDP